jgi:precorrin-6B methylase 2
MTKWKELIEPEVAAAQPGLTDHTAANVSQAISLKRIADYLEGQGRLAARCQELQDIASREIERRRAAEALLTGQEVGVVSVDRIWVDGAEQHTSVGEMAAQAAKHGGAMILDVDTRPDGTQHAHAVATWEDADEGGRTGD